MHLLTKTLHGRIRRLGRPSRLATAAAIVAALTGVAIAFKGVSFDPHGSLQRRADRIQSVDLSSETDQIGFQSVIFNPSVLPIAASEAKNLNAARPLDVAHPHPARPFVIRASTLSSPAYDAALQCLAQAIYYEAGNQGDDGERAVAQVVLNRVRHPAFPHTVCGVVYQGFPRTRGCQFTFTCDGSLSRKPLAAGWKRARMIAREALGGSVFSGVGLATHYHADYVVPYWAPTLVKVSRVGAHLFYQMPGGLGVASAFNAQYDFIGEVASSPPGFALAVASEVSDMPTEKPVNSGIFAPSALRSDTDMGQLIAQGGALRKGGETLSADARAGSLLAGSGKALMIDERSPPTH